MPTRSSERSKRHNAKQAKSKQQWYPEARSHAGPRGEPALRCGEAGVIEGFTRRAYERRSKPRERRTGDEAVRRDRRAAEGTSRGVRMKLKPVLVSPNFLFPRRARPARHGAQRRAHISDHKLAVRPATPLSPMPDGRAFSVLEDQGKASDFRRRSTRRSPAMRPDPRGRDTLTETRRAMAANRQNSPAHRPSTDFFPHYLQRPQGAAGGSLHLLA